MAQDLPCSLGPSSLITSRTARGRHVGHRRLGQVPSAYGATEAPTCRGSGPAWSGASRPRASSPSSLTTHLWRRKRCHPKKLGDSKRLAKVIHQVTTALRCLRAPGSLPRPRLGTVTGASLPTTQLSRCTSPRGHQQRAAVQKISQFHFTDREADWARLTRAGRCAQRNTIQPSVINANTLSHRTAQVYMDVHWEGL